MPLQIAPNSTLLMIGDSITDCGRTRPVGEGMFGELGNGYVSLADALLQSTYPERAIKIINMGISGNTVRDLKARWETDVIKLQPAWLSIMIGINDVWRNFDTPAAATFHVPLGEYTHTLNALLERVRPQLAGLVLLTPYIIEPNRADPMRQMMDRYGTAVKELATRHNALFVDTQAAFDAVLAHMDTAALAGDRIHPNLAGHMVLARAFLEGVGYAWQQ